MDEELKQKVNALEQRIVSLEEYIQNKKEQQISLPIDEASKEIIKATFGI